MANIGVYGAIFTTVHIIWVSRVGGVRVTLSVTVRVSRLRVKCGSADMRICGLNNG